MIWRIGLVILGLALCSYRFGTAVSGGEDIRANGTEVMFYLAPDDPRALLLGDYMALNYAGAGLPPRGTEGRGIAVITVTESVGRFARIATENEDLASNEMLIRYSPRGRRAPTYGGLRYYFQSGTADLYNDAEYGIFKVMPDGRALLSGLANADKKPIAIAGEDNSARIE